MNDPKVREAWTGVKAETAEPTPGPWHWHKSRTQLHLHDGKSNCFSQVSMPSPHNQDQEFAPLYEANAKLIAAAPDLLAACMAAKSLLVGDLEEPGRTVFWKCVAALNKAGFK